VKQAIKLLPRKGSTGVSLAGIARLVKHNKSMQSSNQTLDTKAIKTYI
jgi:hypothetical protein